MSSLLPQALRPEELEPAARDNLSREGEAATLVGGGEQNNRSSCTVYIT